MKVEIKILLKEVRERKGLSLRDLEKLSGISKSQLAAIEKEESMPTLYAICCIAAALKVDEKELYEWKVAPVQPE